MISKALDRALLVMIIAAGVVGAGNYAMGDIWVGALMLLMPFLLKPLVEAGRR